MQFRRLSQQLLQIAPYTPLRVIAGRHKPRFAGQLSLSVMLHHAPNRCHRYSACYNNAMSTFASFAEPGFWLVISLVAAIVLLVARHYATPPWRNWLAPVYWLLIPYLALLAGAVSAAPDGHLLDRLAHHISSRGRPALGDRAAGVGRLDVCHAAWGTRPGAQLGERLGAATHLDRTSWGRRVVLVFPARCTVGDCLGNAATDSFAHLLVCLGSGAHGFAPSPLHYNQATPLRLTKVAILAVTTVVFLYTRNFWLCWLIHAALAVLFTPAILRTERVASSSAA